jgi:hypothetical protein
MYYRDVALIGSPKTMYEGGYFKVKKNKSEIFGFFVIH